MPNVVFDNVTLAFTQNMLRESEYGGWNFSFIINKDVFCDKVREALAMQKNQIWPESKNTNAFILQKCNAKGKPEVAHEATNAMMADNDVLVQIKSKKAPITNTKGAQLGRGTVADLLVDVFEFVYGKREFICLRSHSDRGCTVKVKMLKEYNNGPAYFEVESGADAGFNVEAIEEVVGPF